MNRLAVEIIFKQLFPESTVSSGFDDQGLVKLESTFTDSKPDLMVKKTYNKCLVKVDSQTFYVPIDPETIQDGFKPSIDAIAAEKATIPQYEVVELAGRKKAGDAGDADLKQSYIDMLDEIAKNSGYLPAEVEKMVNEFITVNP